MIGITPEVRPGFRVNPANGWTLRMPRLRIPVRIPGTWHFSLDNVARRGYSAAMARIARAAAVGMPHHVTQRGNRRMTTFFGHADAEAGPWPRRASGQARPEAAPPAQGEISSMCPESVRTRPNEVPDKRHRGGKGWASFSGQGSFLSFC